MTRLLAVLTVLSVAGCALISAGVSIGFLFAVAEHRADHAIVIREPTR